MNGRLMEVVCALESSILAFSAASFSRCSAMRSLRQVDARVLLELARQPLDDALVEVVAAQVGVAVGGLHLEHAVTELQDGDVEGAAAEVVDGDGLLAAALVQAIGQRRGGGLVDDPLHVEAGNPPRVLRGLPLRVVEVRGDGDDRVRHRLPEVVLRGLLHLLQDGRGDLRRRVQRRRGSPRGRRCPTPRPRRGRGASLPAPRRSAGP